VQFHTIDPVIVRGARLALIPINREELFSNHEWTRMDAKKREVIRVHSRLFAVVKTTLRGFCEATTNRHEEEGGDSCAFASIRGFKNNCAWFLRSNHEWTRMEAKKREVIRVHSRLFAVLKTTVRGFCEATTNGHEWKRRRGK
jgi:predicted DNA-binding protein (MmcQ/YjbR family)